MKELIKIQSELKAPKNQRNTFGKYNYRSCEDILEAVKPLANQQGCSIMLSDEIIETGGRVYVKATAILTSGKESATVSAFAREPLLQKGMNEAQITGSASSYARKYALNGLFAIDDTKDADTDEHSKQTNTPELSRPKALTLEGFNFLIKKGTKDQVKSALDTRRMTTDQRDQLKALSNE